jgi:predicted RNase H-like HicB family nuclease
MPLLTVVQDYVIAALKRAVVEKLEDGTLAAYVPEIRGVVAFGADNHECARELYTLIEEWMQVSLTKGYELPILDDIDPNTEAARVLASYHKPIDVESASGDFFANEEELAAAFAQHGKPA